jgi:alkylmercury lyase
MNDREIPTLDRYWNALDEALPVFTPEEQRVAVALYRELAKGTPVTVERLAAALGVPSAAAGELIGRDPLKALVYPDDHGRVVGFGGLAAAPMHHRFEVDGRRLWTWCAWDGLFIPEILGVEARLESPDPESGATVRLTVGPEGILSVEPETAVISFLFPEADAFKESAADAMAGFCHFVFFFASRESGERWTARHEGAFLYSPEDAAELARRLNARRFGDELARRAA